MMKKDEVYDFVETLLESEDFEDILERFDLTPQEVFYELFSSGMIDEDLLSDLSGIKA